MSKTVKVVPKSVLNRFLKKHPNWKLNKKADTLALTVTFHRHVEAMVFIARITVHTEVLGHYPEVLLTKARVSITTSTKEAKGISQRDLDLIERIDHVLEATYGTHSA